MMFGCLCAALAASTAIAQPPAAGPSTVTLTRDNTAVTGDVTVVIPPNTVIMDLDGNGVIHVKAPATVRFAPGSVLRGTPRGTDPDLCRGTGIRIDGGQGVTLAGTAEAPIAIEGFKIGVHAGRVKALELAHVRIRDMWRTRLKSTPGEEHIDDWLWPHFNDTKPWRTQYGAAICLELCPAPVVHDCAATAGQNGLILDRCDGAKVYDCDYSFLSGFGIAMWRTSGATISRNALDYCIRGYSHGVYNRGQDSAGLLMFEQCSDNHILENSMTHSGDGAFVFAGMEALGQGDVPPPKGFDHAGKGCNNNVFRGNDMSCSSGHGLELTFCFWNVVEDNVFEDNAICGIWGGYSQNTLIEKNRFARNGLPGRREGGAINIEHGWNNSIIGNSFKDDTWAIALWDDDDVELLKLPWAKVNHKGSGQTGIGGNTFEGKGTYLRLRRSTNITHGHNTPSVATGQVDIDDPACLTEGVVPRLHLDMKRPVEVLGSKRPVGARTLRGRETMIMTQWGPWDGTYAFAQWWGREEGGDVYEVYGDPAFKFAVEPAAAFESTAVRGERRSTLTLALKASGSVVQPYSLSVTGEGSKLRQTFRAVAMRAQWQVRAFPLGVEAVPTEAQWAAAAAPEHGAAWTAPGLDLRFGNNGPTSITGLDAATKAALAPLGSNYFGIIAKSTLTLPAGRWRVVTRSDDGVRVYVGSSGGAASANRRIIDNWTHHGPTVDKGEFDVPAGQGGGPGVVELEVHYFELSGHALLSLTLEPAGAAGGRRP